MKKTLTAAGVYEPSTPTLGLYHQERCVAFIFCLFLVIAPNLKTCLFRSLRTSNAQLYLLA